MFIQCFTTKDYLHFYYYLFGQDILLDLDRKREEIIFRHTVNYATTATQTTHEIYTRSYQTSGAKLPLNKYNQL